MITSANQKLGVVLFFQVVLCDVSGLNGNLLVRPCNPSFGLMTCRQQDLVTTSADLMMTRELGDDGSYPE